MLLNIVFSPKRRLVTAAMYLGSLALPATAQLSNSVHPVLVVHGGLDDAEPGQLSASEAAVIRAGITRALTLGYAILSSGGTTAVVERLYSVPEFSRDLACAKEEYRSAGQPNIHISAECLALERNWTAAPRTLNRD
jgi:hypothetical protein